MEKLVYLLGDAEPGSLPRARLDLRDALLAAGPALVAAGARRARFDVADLDDPLLEAVYQSNVHGLIDAQVSIWLDSLDTRRDVEAVLAPLSARQAAYLVTESVPRHAATSEPADGGRSPGVSLLTTFGKPQGLDDDTFYARWHGSHTPLSLEIHPLLRYVRNSVARVLTPGAPPLRAIVSEAVASLEIAADPVRFFGSPEGAKRAAEDLMTFVDFPTLSTVWMSEYVLAS